MDPLLSTIEATREAQGLSIRKLAKDSGICRQYYHRLLKGEHTPSIDWCRRAASTLGLELTLQKTANPS
jgi:transcriptional regulator with XRE-family HTH domain